MLGTCRVITRVVQTKDLCTISAQHIIVKSNGQDPGLAHLLALQTNPQLPIDVDNTASAGIQPEKECAALTYFILDLLVLLAK